MPDTTFTDISVTEKMQHHARGTAMVADLTEPSTLTTPDRRSAQVARGICRLFARSSIWCLAEMPLRNGRRADLMGIDPGGRIVIVEIKTARADLVGDGKWTDYLEFCDQFYWGLAPEVDRAVLEGPGFRPDRCGVIIADGYDAEIVRPAPDNPLGHQLAAARRRVETQRLARVALRRQLVAADPQCNAWGTETAG